MSVYSGYKLFLYGFFIIMIQYQIIYDYKELLKSCDYVIVYFKSRKDCFLLVVLFFFFFKKILSFIVFYVFEWAEQEIEYCLGLI